MLGAFLIPATPVQAMEKVIERFLKKLVNKAGDISRCGEEDLESLGLENKKERKNADVIQMIADFEKRQKGKNKSKGSEEASDLNQAFINNPTRASYLDGPSGKFGACGQLMSGYFTEQFKMLNDKKTVQATREQRAEAENNAAMVEAAPNMADAALKVGQTAQLGLDNAQ